MEGEFPNGKSHGQDPLRILNARLFPLPNFVLLPHVVRGLHIFEPRYCEMLSEALETDQLITMATLSPGWETSYLGSPSLHPWVCVGQIIRHQPTDDGRHNILLRGLARGRIAREIEGEAPFRRAEVKIIECLSSPEKPKQFQDQLFAKLSRIFICVSKHFPAVPLVSLLQHPSASIESINAFSYMLASLLPLPVEIQLSLLEETCPAGRIDKIEAWLSKMTGGPLGEADGAMSIWEQKLRNNGQDYPPNFSLN
jgi:Lon protease-like protein